MHNTPEANQAFRETWDDTNRRSALICLELAEKGSEDEAHWTRIVAKHKAAYLARLTAQAKEGA